MDKEQELQVLQGHLQQAESDIFIHNLQKREAQAVIDSLGPASPKDSGALIARRQSAELGLVDLDFNIKAAEAKKDLLDSEIAAYSNSVD